jgi:hypothetical protein
VFSLFLVWVAYGIASGHSTETLHCLNELAKCLISKLTDCVKSSNLTSEKKPTEVEMVALWSSFPCLVSVVTESFTWYVLCLYSWIRGVQSTNKSGKKKKKGAAAQTIGDTSADSDLLSALHRCCQDFAAQLERLISWLKLLSEAFSVSNESVYVNLLANGNEVCSVDDDCVKPGLLLHALLLPDSWSVDEVGERIASIFQNWQPDLAFNKITEGQSDAAQDLIGVLSARITTLRLVMP